METGKDVAKLVSLQREREREVEVCSILHTHCTTYTSWYARNEKWTALIFTFRRFP